LKTCCVWDGFDLNVNVVRAARKSICRASLPAERTPSEFPCKELSKSTSTTVLLVVSFVFVQFRNDKGRFKDWVVFPGVVASSRLGGMLLSRTTHLFRSNHRFLP